MRFWRPKPVLGSPRIFPCGIDGALGADWTGTFLVPLDVLIVIVMLKTTSSRLMSVLMGDDGSSLWKVSSTVHASDIGQGLDLDIRRGFSSQTFNAGFDAQI